MRDFVEHANVVAALTQPSRNGQHRVQISRIAPGSQQEVEWHVAMSSSSVHRVGGLDRNIGNVCYRTMTEATIRITAAI
jgi:hypothetical protein